MNQLVQKSIALLCLISCYYISYGQENSYLPKQAFKGQLVVEENFTLFYLEEHEQAAWVAYELTKEDAFSQMDRTDNFREDSRILTGSATLQDYRGSGFDRGHQIPAGDAKASKSNMSATFLFSNITPQKPDFNRRTMRLMENLIRGLVGVEDRLFVVTGPIFKDNIGSIGVNQVTVPGYYYKVILDLTPPIKMLAFILPHKEGISADFWNYSVSVDSVENLTKIDFFAEMDIETQEFLEKYDQIEDWGIKELIDGKSKSAETKYVSEKNVKNSNRCLGIAKSTNQRCKITSTDQYGYCRYHTNQNKR